MTAVTYAYYPVFKATPELRERPGGDLEQLAHDADILIKEWSDRVSVRGTYSTVGFRPDADLMMWWVGETPEDLQHLTAEFRRTGIGKRLELRYAFMGVVRPAEFSKDHVPAFLKGEQPKKYLCVYPFVRTSEWYLLPPEERASMLREHGEIGREFPDVLANTTSAFGLGDWEWILAFEADDLPRIVDCIRRLRAAEARRYTKEEIPFVTGIRKEFVDAVRDLA
ncbi:MAG TPA: hydrogen peroxide-dependent heme synthase [Actinomycetota bacterium]|nr:hydrogen peroxide-dependent heme synthase [Actinomycetota bacterium]